jgi:hypothetical protein
VNADERLREVIHGGPYEPYVWVVLVRLAAWADDDGMLDAPELALVADWVGGTETRAKYCLKVLKADGWLVQNATKRWDISVNLRQAPRARADIRDRGRGSLEPPGVRLFRPDIP